MAAVGVDGGGRVAAFGKISITGDGILRWWGSDGGKPAAKNQSMESLKAGTENPTRNSYRKNRIDRNPRLKSLVANFSS